MSLGARAGLGGTAVVFGAVLGRIGFASWDEVHGMFRLQDPRLIATFSGAVLILAVAWRVIAWVSRPSWSARPLHPGSLPGGLLFGAGWALCGACPSTVFVQLGEGQLLSLCTLVGILIGNLLFGIGQGRWFRFSTGASCAQDN